MMTSLLEKLPRLGIIALAVCAVVAAGVTGAAALGGTFSSHSHAAQGAQRPSTGTSPSAGAQSSPSGGKKHGKHTKGKGHLQGARITVTRVQGNTITGTARNGDAVTVQVSNSTVIRSAHASTSLSSVKPGLRIVARGVKSGNTIQAQKVHIAVPRLEGTVTAIRGSTYTISPIRGSMSNLPTTITTTSSTTFKTKGNSGAAAVTAIKVGTVIIARGNLSTDGKSFVATRVTTAPAKGATTGKSVKSGHPKHGKHQTGSTATGSTSTTPSA